MNKATLKEIEEQPQFCNDRRFEDLKKSLESCRYWVFENNSGRFVFTEDSLYFQSLMPDKEFERFPYFKDYYFNFRNKFVDFAVIGFDEKVYMLCLFENNHIKPLMINGCYCGDIVIHDTTKINEFHYSCGHAMINNEKIKVVKSFGVDIKGYQLEKFKGNNFTGLY